MKKLLIILLLFFPVHGAWADETEGMTPEELDEFYSKHKKPNYFDKYDDPPPEPEEKTWLEKQKDKREKKANDKYYCSKKSGKANTTTAANRIYNACMEKKGY